VSAEFYCNTQQGSLSREPKNADSLATRFRDLSSNIKEGTLFFALTNIQAASMNRLIPPGILTQLDKALGNVKDALDVAQQSLSRVREDRILGKLKYAIWQGEGGKSKLDKQFRALKNSCDELKEMCKSLPRGPRINCIALRFS
jgi:hypothetical protein